MCFRAFENVKNGFWVVARLITSVIGAEAGAQLETGAKHGVMAPGLWARLQSLPRHHHLGRWSSSEARRSEPSLKEADDAALSERGLSLWQVLEPLVAHFVVVAAEKKR